MEIEQLKQLYIESLSTKEMQAYIIAKQHLSTSFQLEKSIGFVTFCENYVSKEGLILKKSLEINL
jgi:hypothetical protein